MADACKRGGELTVEMQKLTQQGFTPQEGGTKGMMYDGHILERLTCQVQ